MSSDDDDDVPTLLSQDHIDEIMQAIRPGETPNASLLEPILRRFKSAPRAVDIVTAFDDMCLPEPLIAQLQPLFDEYGLQIEVAFVQDPYNLKKARSYTVAIGPEYSLVVLHLKPGVIKNSDGVAFLIQATTNLREKHLRIVSQDVDTPAFGYNIQLTAVSERQPGQWSFVSWSLVLQALLGQIKLENALGFDPARLKDQPAKPDAWTQVANLELNYQDREAIVRLIEESLVNDPSFLAGLIKAAAFPAPLTSQAMSKLSGTFDNQIREVLTVIRFWGSEPLGTTQEHTCLGRFLTCFRKKLGSENKKIVQDIIVKYGLVKPGSE